MGQPNIKVEHQHHTIPMKLEGKTSYFRDFMECRQNFKDICKKENVNPLINVNLREKEYSTIQSIFILIFPFKVIHWLRICHLRIIQVPGMITSHSKWSDHRPQRQWEGIHWIPLASKDNMNHWRHDLTRTNWS